MSAVIVIPARFGSVRFPGKVLARQTGKYLIQHVWEQARQAKCASRVILAVEDPRTVDAAKEFGAEAVLTDPNLPSGTDRVAAVARMLDGNELIINVQGDEPEIDPRCIDQLAELMAEGSAAMGTLGTPFMNFDEPKNPNAVKVVCDKTGSALYFSRSLIPFPRDGVETLPKDFQYFLHLGIYAYHRDFLLTFTQLPPAPLEQIEKLEQLRALWHGYRICVGITDYRSRGVDTPEEYAAFVERYAKKTK